MARVKMGSVARGALISFGIFFPATFASAQEGGVASTGGDAGAASALGDIVVTAQRRSENIQTVPITIQAFSQERLETAAAKGVEDLPLLTPGLTMQRNSGGSTPFIRGIGSPTANAGTEAAVATYVDGVYRQGLYTSHLSFSDVERVEVLKGPQGTLFGRNTTGGLIHIITKDPSADPHGNFSVSVGNYETYEVAGYGSTGIVDNVALSVGGYARRQENAYGTNLLTGNGVSYRNETSGNGKLQFNDGTTKITLAADYSYVEDPRGFTRGTTSGAIGGTPTRRVDGVVVPGLSFVRQGGYHDLSHNRDAYSNSDSYGGSVTLERSFGGVDAISITAWRHDFTDISQDNDFTAFDLSHAFIQFYTHNFTQEFRFSSNGDGPFNWIGGFFYLDSNAGNSLDILSGPNVVQRLRGRVDTKSYSVFAEGSVRLFGDAGKLTIGGRYTIDKRRIAGSVNGASVPPPAIARSKKWEEPTYRIVYDHRITDDVMLYASYNRGFKSGNYNIIPATTAPFNPEKLDAFEIGAKTTLFDDRVRFNASGFYYDYKDLQLTISNATSVTTINAANARIYGAEAELNAALTDALTLDLGASYVHGEYRSFKNAEIYVPNMFEGAPTGGNTRVTGFDASGQRIIRTPRFTGSAGLTYTHMLEAGNIVAVVRGSYNSGFNWEPSGRVKQGAYALVNASLGYTSNEGWGIRVQGNNITNAKYANYGGAVAFSDFYSASDPATYSVVATFSF